MPARIGGRSSKSGTPWPGTYSPRSISSSVVRGAMRTFTPRRCAASTISSSRLSSRPASATISSSSCAPGERLLDLRAGIDSPDELVVDAAAARAERLAQVRARGSRRRRAARRRRTPTAAHERPGERLVAPAEQADQHRDEDRADDVEAEGREVLAGADRERERERGDEEHARHDPARALAQLARRVEAGCARRRARAAG